MVIAGDLVMETAAVQETGLRSGTGSGTGLGPGLGTAAVQGLGAGQGPGQRVGDGGIDDFAPSSSSSSTPVVRMLTEKEVGSLTIEQRKALFRGDPISLSIYIYPSP